VPPKIQVTTDHGIAHIVLANPEKLNAIDFDAGQEFRDACISSMSAGEVRVILLTALGPAFCVGGDLLAMAHAEVSGTQVTDAAHIIHEGIAALVGSSKPVVAAVRGAVAGGGIGLMLAADYVVAGADLRVAGSYADVGLTPDLGVSTLLTRAVGERRALEILLGRRELDAKTAHEWGMVAEVTDDPDGRATAIAQQWAEGPSRALGDAKRLVRASGRRDFAVSLADEASSIGAAFDGDEARQRIEAFAAASAARGAKR
jgi:2-(1,2-epoxy-1,2-dihydrophenyl)acetyl-CoA isomerase